MRATETRPVGRAQLNMTTPRSFFGAFLVVLVLLVDASLAHRRCSTHDPTPQGIESSNKLAHTWLENGGRRKLQETITLPVCFHVVRPDSSEFLETPRLQAQLDALNAAYSSGSCCDLGQAWCNGECSIETGFRFEMALLDASGSWAPDAGTTPTVADANTCVTRFVNGAWYAADAFSADADVMKRSLRVGDASVLNVYFKAFFDGTLGYAAFPDEFSIFGDIDGVVMNEQTLIGATDPSYSQYQEGVSE